MRRKRGWSFSLWSWLAGRLGAKGRYALLKAQLIADGAWAEERILGKIKAEGGTGIKAEEWAGEDISRGVRHEAPPISKAH